ncbi:VCBS repeat-containing protein [Rhodobacteraceae bacterium CCMM004]|nr:VCBS repeat-containing protein [Rhodobacteraceae bacterium CCMM004]
MRRAAALILALLPIPGAAAGVPADCLDRVAAAAYEAPTDRYPHAVLGDDLEWGGLRVTVTLKLPCRAGSATFRAVLPDELVFEDTAPRIVDLDGTGLFDVLTVESHRDRGARLTVWRITAEGPVRAAATPFIGTRFRWLAPVGAADLDGDGAVEVAYVDRPHLAKTLRVWRWRDGGLHPVADLPGVTNHRIGETDIAGGIRDCGQGPEMIVADAGWARLLAVTLVDGRLTARDIGPHRGRASFAAAAECR